jgi:hypothetical protein
MFGMIGENANVIVAVSSMALRFLYGGLRAESP